MKFRTLNRISKVFLFVSLLISCSSPQRQPIVKSLPVDRFDETFVIEVKAKSKRNHVESFIVEMSTGNKLSIEHALREGIITRIRDDEEFAGILRDKFHDISDHSEALKIWRLYPNATLFNLEGGSKVIVFFDNKDRTVQTWPKQNDY
jgi:hypothetical protein